MATGRGKRVFWGLLTIVLGGLFLLDIVVPDPLPFVDELVTGLLTAASAIKTLQEFWKRARGGGIEKRDER